MNRLWILMGTCLGALLLIGVGHQYLNDENKEPPQKQVTLAKATAPHDTVPQEPPVLSKAEAFAKLQELAKEGPATPDLAEGLRRAGGKKAIEPLVGLMRSTTDYRTVGACVIALQEYRDPTLFPDMLVRLEEIGVLDQPGKLPWFSKRLFNEYLKTGLEPELAQKVLKLRPGLQEQPSTVVQAPVEHKP